MLRPPNFRPSAACERDTSWSSQLGFLVTTSTQTLRSSRRSFCSSNFAQLKQESAREIVVWEAAAAAAAAAARSLVQTENA